MLYIFDGIDLLSDNFPGSKADFLSEERRKKVNKLRFNKSKKASAAAYLLLRIALKENYGINEAVEFSYGEKGKPLLKDYPLIHFSLSHSANTVACAVADFEVGVDVQQITEVKDKVAKRVLTDDEYSKYKDSLAPDEYFCEIWTIKESFLKKTGQGITKELREISADDIKNKKVYKGKDYFCCVCGKEQQSIQIKFIGREDFEQLC